MNKLECNIYNIGSIGYQNTIRHHSGDTSSGYNLLQRDKDSFRSLHIKWITERASGKQLKIWGLVCNKKQFNLNPH